MSGSVGAMALGSPQMAPSPPGIAQHLPTLDSAHEQAKGNFASTSATMERVDKLRSTLDSLTKLGDSVTPEEIIEASGKLVAQGEDPNMLATLLADMPQGGGEALNAWLQQHAAQLTQVEARVGQSHAIAQHQLGVTAMHNLAAHSLGSPLNPQSAAQQAGSLGQQQGTQTQ